MLPEGELHSLAQELFQAGVAEVTSLEPTGRTVRVHFVLPPDTAGEEDGGEWTPEFNVPMVNCTLKRVHSYETEELLHDPLVSRLNELLAI